MFGVSTQPAHAGGGRLAPGCLKFFIALIGVWTGSTLCPAPLSVAASNHSPTKAAVEALGGTERVRALPAIALAALDRASLEDAFLRLDPPDRLLGSGVQGIRPSESLGSDAFTEPSRFSSALPGPTSTELDDTSGLRPALWPAVQLAALSTPSQPTLTAAPVSLIQSPSAPTDRLSFREQPAVAALASPEPLRPEQPFTEPAGLRVFGSVPLRTSSRALTRIVSNALDVPGATCRNDASGNRCGNAVPPTWRNLARELQSLSAHTLLDRANREVNTRIRYTTDQDLHGVLDHWSSAAETMAEGAGDCEDFAILKMWLLRQAGMAAEDMFIVVVRSPNLRTEHAVLAVRMEAETYILDNLSTKVRNARDVGYMPIFSTNAHGLWLHGFTGRRDLAERAIR